MYLIYENEIYNFFKMMLLQNEKPEFALMKLLALTVVKGLQFQENNIVLTIATFLILDYAAIM